MPGLGPAAAFLTGWNQADDAEKDRRLEEMRVLTSGARDLSTAASQQSTMRREEQLFPDLQRSQELRNMGANIANLQARSDLDVSRQTAPSRIRQTQVDLNQSLLDYENGIITRDELMSRIEREGTARRRFEGETGRTVEDFKQFQEAGPGMQIQAAQQQNLFGLGATEKALQSKFNAAVVQEKINSGLIPQQAQAEMLDIVNQSNLLAAQAYAAIQKPYLAAISKAGVDEKTKADAKRKAINETMKEIGDVEAALSAIEGKVTLQGALDAGLPASIVAILNPANDNKTSAMARIENYKNARINLLFYNHGVNYYTLSRKAPEFQQAAPALSSEALLAAKQLDEMQRNILPSAPNPNQIQQIPGMTQVPGMINLQGVGTPSPQPGATIPTTTTPATPQGWGSLDINKILEAYGTLGETP